MDVIDISPAVLDWAASQAGAQVEEIAQKMSKRSVDKIVQGQLTYPQVLKYAKLTGVPLGFLFLEEPPQQRPPPLADFRTLPDAHPLSRDFFDVYDDIEFKHSWLKENAQIDGAEPLPFVGKYATKRPSVEVLAFEMRETIGFTEAAVADLKNADQLFTYLVDRCEKIGIFVFKNGVVGNNGHRPLSVAEFRGFAIADEYYPVVFINGADAPAAWVFTLAHELAHLWLGDSAISDAGPSALNNTEIYCNAVAGEFLVPQETFLSLWKKIDDIEIDLKLDIGRRSFKVSKTVVARRALDLGLISKDQYFEVYNLARKVAKEKKTGGGDFYRSLAVRNSKAFSNHVANLAISGSITLGQAGRLLNTSPNNVLKLHEKRNAISI